jgi:hypothetical protein
MDGFFKSLGISVSLTGRELERPQPDIHRTEIAKNSLIPKKSGPKTLLLGEFIDYRIPLLSGV